MGRAIQGPKGPTERKLHCSQIGHQQNPNSSQFEPNTPLEDDYHDQNLQPDTDVIIAQDDLYSIAWETDFGNSPFEQPITERNEQPSNPDVKVDAAQQSSETTYWSTRPQPTNNNGSPHSEVTTESNGPTPTEGHKAAQDDAPKEIIPNTNKNDVNEKTVPRIRNDHENTDANADAIENTPRSKRNEIASKNAGGDVTVPGTSGNDKNCSEENSSPRGGKYNLRPNPNPNFQDEYRY